MFEIVSSLHESSNEQSFVNKCLCNPQSQLYYTNLIPIGQKWEVESITKNTLKYKNIQYTVCVSDVDKDNTRTHFPYFLFNGKKENERGNRWATSSHRTGAYISISFDIPQQANVLSMTSRNGQDCSQAPTSFEIVGSEEEISLYKKFGVEWEENTKLNFTFQNTKSYYYYKIYFYTSDSPECYFGLAELNLGMIS